MMTECLLQDTQGLVANERSFIFSNAYLARAYVETQVVMKFDFATKIPWLICGLMHPKGRLARAFAMECVRQYALASRDAHHRLSILVLDDDQNFGTCARASG